MPSPFPGMDPYLEHPALWPGVHQGLITFMGSALNALLPPTYVASIGERLYVVQPERDLYPDVAVLERVGSRPSKPQEASESPASDPPWVLTLDPVEVREVYIDIVPVGDESRVVTAIEVLSPANKTDGNTGRQLYLTKQQELLASQTHCIEIDLLRSGAHTVAAPRDFLRQRGAWDYLVCLHRGGQGQRYEVWAVSMRQRLPRIRVPLAENEPDVVLDLQTVFERCYDEGAYARRVDYRQPPRTPLATDDAAWADALLRERGMR
jgi:hypothetical protein